MPALSSSDAAAVFELMQRVAHEHDIAAATSVLEIGLGDMVAARVALVVVDTNGTIWSPRPPSLRGAATTVGLGPVARIARGEYSVVTSSSVIVPLDAVGDPGLVLIAYRATDATPIDDRRARIVASTAAHVAPIVRGMLDPDANLLPSLVRGPIASVRTRDDATVRVDPLTPPVPMAPVRPRLADRVADRIVAGMPRPRTLVLAFAFVIATAIGVCSPVGPTPPSVTSGPGPGLPSVGEAR